jgi:hypothetical protein
MSGRSLYRVLVPDAPQHRRTEGDGPGGPGASPRAAAARRVVPGLQAPGLTSSFAGSIDRILFSFPAWAVADPKLPPAYTSVLGALRVGTRFIVVHNPSVRPVIEQWFTAAGHPLDNVDFVPVPDYVLITDWAEDAYVSLKDADDDTAYLMEPWSFLRAGDALIADAVEEHTAIRASGSPLVFQGGNCLIGSDFWLLGADYFADSVALLSGSSSPVPVPAGTDPRTLVATLFSTYVESRRRLIQIGTRKPIPLRDYVGTKEGDDHFLDLPTGGAGTFQPIFHIDMFITLVGADDGGPFQVMVGSPTLADQHLGTSSPFGLADVYDGIAKELENQGFAVTRNPLVHRPTLGPTYELRRLRELSMQPDGETLVPAVAELTAAGADDGTKVRIRDWHHITWNNCLVENSQTVGKHVYLPTFGHGPQADLAAIDDEMKSLWESLGFTVHLLGDFNPFAARLGVVHCIKKYVTRGG